MFTKKTTNTSRELLNNPYRSVDYLPMFNYYKIIDTGDLRYLLRLDNYEHLPDVDVSELSGVWVELQYTITDLHNELSRKNQIIFDKQKQIAMLQYKLFRIQSLLLLLRLDKNEDSISELAELGYSINPKQDFSKELERIGRVSRGINTKFSIIQGELNDLTKQGKKVDIVAVKQSIEEYYNMSTPIDMHAYTMKEWLHKQYGAINKTAKKQLQNG